MPLSMPFNQGFIATTIWKYQPKSVLDVGCGFGKYGVIFREYLDVLWERYDKSEWKARIDAVEACDHCITPLHRYIYNTVFIGDARKISIPQHYDLVFMGDVLEHMPKEDGEKLIDKFDTKWILISTPTIMVEQKPYKGNEYEKHEYIWKEEDFKFEKYNVLFIRKIDILLTVMLEKK